MTRGASSARRSIAASAWDRALGWRAALDGYAVEHLPARIDGTWLADARSHQPPELLPRAFEALTRLLGPLASDERRTSAAWADALAALLGRIWPEIEPGARDGDAHRPIRPRHKNPYLGARRTPVA